MPMPAPPYASGTSSPITPRPASPRQTSSVVPALVVEHRAHVRDRRPLGEEAAHGLSRSISWSSVNSKSNVASRLAANADVDVRGGTLPETTLRPMRLRYGAEDEAFRAELVAWLEEHQPSAERLREPKQSSADMPPWAREWQRTLFDAGWLVPGWPPELGGRNATPTAADDLLRGDHEPRDRRAAHNPQGLGIIAPSINDYGTPEQKERFLAPDAAGRDRVVPRA